VLADGSATTVGDLADVLGRSPSATSRLVDGLVKRRLVERREEPEDRRQRLVALTQRGQALLRSVDRARADQFLTTVRPLPTTERALVAMGVAALATHAISRRGRLIRGERVE
jgi:DNA-binding MarR family transcriptional regulator